MQIVPGSRCQIVKVRFRHDLHRLGRVIVVTKVNLPEFDSVWAHDDSPVTYRTNRNGRRVVVSDPRCIQSIYSLDEIRLLPCGSLSSSGFKE